MHVSTLASFAYVADRIVTGLLHPRSSVREELVCAGRLGGYLCTARQDGIPLLVVSIGEPHVDKLPRYIEFCQEKARRLAEYPGDVLSLESRNPDLNRFGGAVRGEDYIASFSGFPERLDEVVAALVLSTGDISFGEAIERLGDNPYVNAIGHRELASLVD